MNIRLTNIDTCSAYLQSKGLTLKVGSVSVTKQPWHDGLTCYKYNATLSNSAGKKVYLHLYGSAAGYTKNEPASAWELIYCNFSDALSYINSKDIDDFVNLYGFDKIIEALKAYRGCKSMWKKLLSLGLSHDDIAAIAERICDGERYEGEEEEVAQ